MVMVFFSSADITDLPSGVVACILLSLSMLPHLSTFSKKENSTGMVLNTQP